MEVTDAITEVVTDAITEVVTDATTEDTNESANQLSVLSNYFNHSKKIVESGSEKQKSFFFKKHIPHLFSNMEMPAVDDSEHLVLKEKTTSKGRPRKIRKPRVQSRIKPLVELEEDDEKSKKLKKIKNI